MSEVVPPELTGQMAAIGTTNLPLEMCPSCARALIYGALIYAGAVKEDIDLALMTEAANPSTKVRDLLYSAEQRQATLLDLLVQFVHNDFGSTIPTGAVTNEDDWSAAMDAFLRTRIATYVGDDGRIIFESHETDAHP